MFKAMILIFGVCAYLIGTHAGYVAAIAGLSDIENLYTRASVEAAVISSANR